jgi:WD40 repeat protein
LHLFAREVFKARRHQLVGFPLIEVAASVGTVLGPTLAVSTPSFPQLPNDGIGGHDEVDVAHVDLAARDRDRLRIRGLMQPIRQDQHDVVIARCTNARTDLDASGRELRQLQPAERAESLCFAADGKTLASVGYGGTLRLWDVASGKEFRRFEEPIARVQPASFAPDGQSLAATGPNPAMNRDYSIRL